MLRIEPIYRDLVHMVDVIKEGDQYYNYSTNDWATITSNYTVIGDTYNTDYFDTHRRLDTRIMFLKELLNSNG
jgi:hypothetical protein